MLLVVRWNFAGGCSSEGHAVGRIQKIIENIHCNDNNTIFEKSHPKYDKLHKLSPLNDMLNANLGKVYKPSSYYTVDESMIAFKGRCVLKQYMPMKTVKKSYKVWCLADSTTGFIIAFIIYTGKEGIILNSTLGERVVLNFAVNIRPGSNVVIDHFFYKLFASEKFAWQKHFCVWNGTKGLPKVCNHLWKRQENWKQHESQRISITSKKSNRSSEVERQQSCQFSVLST